VKVQSPEQGDVEHGTKASNNATKPHAPSKPSAADVQMTRASTDAGGKESHHPAVASTLEKTPKSPPSDDAQTHVVLSIEPRAEESQAATEPTQQQSPALSTSQRLWNAAFDRLEEDKDTAELVRSYIKTLATVLKTEASEKSISDADNVAAELKDPSKRQMNMKKLVEEGQAKVDKVSKITRRLGDFANAILSVKPMIDLAIQNIPQAAPAALPWAGVCIGLQVGIHYCIV
jgi:predicted HAD superfamily Cof-like phosphohydrolase